MVSRNVLFVFGFLDVVDLLMLFLIGGGKCGSFFLLSEYGRLSYSGNLFVDVMGKWELYIFFLFVIKWIELVFDKFMFYLLEKVLFLRVFVLLIEVV